MSPLCLGDSFLGDIQWVTMKTLYAAVVSPRGQNMLYIYIYMDGWIHEVIHYQVHFFPLSLKKHQKNSVFIGWLIF